MLQELKKEYKKVANTIAEDQRKLDALRRTMKEYGISLKPNESVLSDVVMECLQKHNGHASFDTIANCLYEHGVDTKRSNISLSLTKNPAIRYNREQAEWILIDSESAANPALQFRKQH